jgi:hypothetical protein
MLQEIQETTVVTFAVKSFAGTKTIQNYWNKLNASLWWERYSISEIINCLEQERHLCLILDDN